MRKMNWIIGTVALGLGIGIGVLSIALASNPTAPDLLAKMHLGTNNEGIITTSQDGQAVAASVTPGQDGIPASHSGDEGLPPDPLATAGTEQGTVNASTDAKDTNDGAAEKVSALLAQQIIGDYKQDIGFFFDAWKSADMTAYRSKLARAYSGQLLERHARQAQDYILQGVGLDVSNISFDNVVVEMAEANTATLRADYRYTASDFILKEGKTVGTPNEHVVHVRVNLIKSGQRWVITGEVGMGAVA
ncbi:MAG: hypothetical protein QMC95_06230 [Desulfitobacteriaceae bacterium]|nr:hypothetical protein [Desulfitobacteriaceae bacterium]MDI6878280.1 hypothetical protein [Desulfitobacteriaceae bacterium]MDI6913802.1 hypothetical protein [Desulfitobacteriaceae bacterium]